LALHEATARLCVNDDVDSAPSIN